MTPDKARTYRFYCPEIPEAGEVSLSGEEAHHAQHVLRLKAGAGITLFDGQGRSAEARIVSASRGKVAAEVSGLVRQSERQGRAVHLAFAVPKGKRLDWLLEKASELGAWSLWPVVFERSVAGSASLNESQLARWRGHCVAAAKQCGSDFVPAIGQPVDLPGLIARSAGCLCVMGDVAGRSPGILEVLGGRVGEQGVCLLVGPEGGLTAGERAELESAAFVGASLATSTLRIETAAVALLACVAAKLA